MNLRVIGWTMIGLLALALGCYALAHIMIDSSPSLGFFLPAWIYFGYATTALAVIEGIVGLALLLRENPLGRSLLLSACIVALVGPGLCAVTGMATFFL